ncbi:ABC transporter permease [Paenibacillus senegalensis]|uniref:ABC transporter permease n=1 Tax=Paenibacillus senegalensis TaxID=1465766 RepID=UPI000287DE5D|nr:ABC transporter permease [Paenibacillus senegalensis]
MNSLGAVIRFTFKNRFFTKSTIITTLIFILLISIAINLPYLISLFISGETKQETIAMIEDETGIAAELQSHFAALGDDGLSIVLVPDAGSEEANTGQLMEGITTGSWQGYLQLQFDGAESFPAVVYYSQEDLSSAEQTMLMAGLQAAKTQLLAEQLNLNEAQLAQLQAPVSLEISQLSEEGQPVQEGEGTAATGTRYALVYILIILLFFGVVMYGNLIATEVTAEKSSRVMEILISSISPVTQMFGKVIGMMLLAMLQLFIYFITAVVNLLLPHNIEMLRALDINISEIPISLIIAFFFFYFAGFLLYSLIFAALGSLISRTEELSQAVTPLTFVLLAAFYIGIFGMNTPDSTFMVVSSFIPFFTPFLLFLRMGLGSVAGWEIALGILLLIATILFFTWLAAKIYRVGVLMYGKKPSIKEIIKAMKAYNV